MRGNESAISINFLTIKHSNVIAVISKTYYESRQFLIFNYYLKLIRLFLLSVFKQIYQARIKKKRKWQLFAVTHEMVHTHLSTCMPAHYRILLLHPRKLSTHRNKGQEVVQVSRDTVVMVSARQRYLQGAAREKTFSPPDPVGPLRI